MERSNKTRNSKMQLLQSEITVSKYWNFVKTIFAKPYLVSILVGFSIHILFEINTLLFYENRYVVNLIHEIINMPFSGSLQLLIPFIVPFIIATVSRKIVRESLDISRYSLFNDYPDLIIQVNAESKIIYLNKAVKNFLSNLHGDEISVSQLLPDDIRKIINDILLNNRHVNRRHEIEDRILNLNITPFMDDTIIISGRKIKYDGGQSYADVERGSNE